MRRGTKYTLVHTRTHSSHIHSGIHKDALPPTSIHPPLRVTAGPVVCGIIPMPPPCECTVISAGSSNLSLVFLSLRRQAARSPALICIS